MNLIFDKNYSTTHSGKARSNGIEIYYECFGNASDPAIVLVMGLDAQCVIWSMNFIEPLVAAGFYVIRFDNRDIGLSTWVEDWHRSRPYTLEDMAADTVGLLDALHIEKAHIIGASMGGMIAQRVAISYPKRILTLTSIMSSGFVLDTKATNRIAIKLVFVILPYIIRYFTVKNRFTDHKVNLKTYMATYRMLSGTKYPFNQTYFEQLFQWSIFERKGQNPKARLQQYSAIVASGSRLKELPKIKCPTLILHGTADKLVPPIHAKIYAPLIPDAKMVWLDGVGHEIPNGVLDQVHKEILGLLT